MKNLEGGNFMPTQVVLEKLIHDPTPFPYSLQMCGNSLLEKRKRGPIEKIAFHIHPHCQITQSGEEITYIIEKEAIELKKGDVLIINPNIPHARFGSQEAIQTNLGFYPEMLELNGYCRVYSPFLSTLYSNMYPYILLRKANCDRMKITEILDDISRIHKHGGMAIDGVVHNRFVDLSILLIQWIMKVEDKNINRVNKVLSKSMEYIEQHRAEPITIEDVADEVGLNPSYFSHCFKKNLGISFKQFLNRKRLETAAIELTTTDHQITNIAFECGFGSMATFYQNFIDFYKISPKKFRDLNRKKAL